MRLCGRAKLILRVLYPKQGRQYTYNVTLTGVRATIVSVEKQLSVDILSVCV